MKQGKRPTREQKFILKRLGFAPADWLVCKNTSTELVITCRHTGQYRTISKDIIQGR